MFRGTSIKKLSEKLRSGELSPSTLVNEAFEKIRKSNSAYTIFVDTYEDQATTLATDLDKQFQESPDSLSPLAGIPIGIKDNMNDQGFPTRCASKILEGYVSPYSATAVQKCRDAGMIPVGKLNMDEFAMGSSNEHSIYGPARNPWNYEYVPGGSSGGSAAAVAAGYVPLSLGSDTGGSIRQPASFCGVVGLKPSYGRVSRFGLVAFASSLDQIGPMANSVEDAAYLLNVISGKDPYDSTSESLAVPDYTQGLDNTIKGKKIGILKDFLSDQFDPDVRQNFTDSIERLTELGAEIVPIDFEGFKDAISAYYIIAPCEASANLARFDGVRFGYRSENGATLKSMISNTRGEGFGDEVKRRIILGTFALSSGYYDAYYIKAQKMRTLIKQNFDAAFQNVDFIATPTSPTPAFKLGEISDPMTMYLNDLTTIPVNLAGLPGISVPSGLTKEKLPLGIQFIANSFEEQSLLSLAYQFEQSIGFENSELNLKESL